MLTKSHQVAATSQAVAKAAPRAAARQALGATKTRQAKAAIAASWIGQPQWGRA
jgi:hypothetical protein